MRKTISSVTILLIGISVAWSCQMSTVGNNVSIKKEKKMISNDNGLRDTATFGAGCFWCVEAAFMQLSGVDSVKSGYSGGFIKNPSYKEVCNGNTGHAEVVQIIYNPSVIDFTQLMEVFFTVHDPTQLNRQGNDIGTQYRSVVFYHNDQQRAIAEKAILAAESSGDWEGKIVTEIKSFEAFYPAEDYHDNYYNQNKEQAYCSLVIKPKMDKFQKKFHDLLKTP